MAETKPFDVYNCALTGRNMVTAGAGTGKTYSIQILFLRMILANIPVKEILVVTFTNLATDELKNRLRKILQSACDFCDALLEAKDDETRNALLDNTDYQQVAPCFSNVQGDTLSVYRKRIIQAMRDFDSAPISTIHGFCSRILRENAFDSGVRYGMEMRSSVKALVKQAMSQFWRSFSNENKLHRQLAVKLMGLTPDSMQKDLADVFSNPDVKVVWNVTQEQLKNAEEYIARIEDSSLWNSLSKALQNLSNEDIEELDKMKLAFLAAFKPAFSQATLLFWQEMGDDVLLHAFNTIKAALEDALKNKKKKQDPKWSKSDVLDSLLNNTCEDVDMVEQMISSKGDKNAKTEFNSLRETNDHVKSYCSALADVFKLQVLLDFYKTFVLHLAWQTAEKKIEQAKARDGFMTYDDLLLILSKRLDDGTVGERLRKVIQEKYSAVIVDEFQDTDAHQSAIFNALLASDGSKQERAERTYFMIGDEKQAIYMFRGGDVHTFFKEKQACGDNVFSLTRNFRSSSAFIATMNDFWEKEEKNFFQPDNTIHFENIGDPERHLQLLCDGKEVTGNDLLNFRESKNTREDICSLIYQYTSKSPDGTHRYVMRKEKNTKNEDKAVTYSDIAVLVRTNKEGSTLRDHLRSQNIPAVLMKSRSIFKSSEALQMLYFLDAVLNPGDMGKALFLLLQKLFALPPEDMNAIRSACLPRFQVYLKKLLDDWQNTSFLQMFKSFMHDTLSRMMPGINFQEQADSNRDGEGDSTKSTVIHALDETTAVRIAREMSRDTLSLFMQIANVLHTVSLEKHLGPLGLYDFLDQHCEKPADSAKSSYNNDEASADSIDEDEDEDELYASSLPTQDDAVRILTVHTSKGLEFPIVLVPQFTSSKSPCFKNRICHDDEEQCRVVNMTTHKERENSCCNERYAELKRLMYVAITRAIFACHFVSKVDKDKSEAISNKPSPTAQQNHEQPEVTISDLESELEKINQRDKELGRKTTKNAAEKNSLEEKKEALANAIKYYQTILEHPEFLLASRPSEDQQENCNTGDEAKPANGDVQTAAPTPQGDTTVVAESFNLKSDAFTPGWLTTSFSEMSKGRLKPDKPPQTESSSHDDDDTDEDAEPLDTMRVEPWVDKVPYAERTPIFQFVGGKRTGACWHKVFEELDFTLFSEEQSGSEAFLKQKARIINILDTYGQLGHNANRDVRLNAFMDMLTCVCRQTVRIGDEAPWRLADIAPASCLHECDFTYKFRQSISGEDLRNILDRFPESSQDLRKDWMHGFSSNQMFTGSIDLLFQNPADRKYVIVDWKTNLLDANPESFTPEGVRQEMISHVYPLQCILYSVAFVQYYCKLANIGCTADTRQAAITEAYSHFGGCADLFVRGVREEDGRLYGVYPIKPPLELLLKLDECCGVTLNPR